jgi:NitT/TauT family transport system substrate-binding protein
MLAYRETIDWMYSDPAALKQYAEFAGVSEKFAQRLRDDFFPKATLSPDNISGIKSAIKETKIKLSRRQTKELIQIPPPARSGSTGWSSFRMLLSR